MKPNEKQRTASETQNDGGVNGGVNDLFIFISNHPGIKTSALVKQMNTPRRTIERWLKQLRE